MNVKESSLSQYYKVGYNHILDQFGKRIPQTITEEEIIEHLHAKSKNMKTNSIYTIIFLINSLWAYMYRKNLIKDQIKLPYPQFIKNEIFIFDLIEQKQLIDYIMSHLNTYSLSILVCLYMGFRIGEICALKWDNIDLKNKIIRIRWTMQRTAVINLKPNQNKTKIIIDTPKSKTSIRDVPIPDVLLKLLSKFKAPSDCYLTTSKKQYIEPRQLQKRYKTILKRAKIDYKKFHTLRHTFATNAYFNGMSLKVLSEILGHSNIYFTQNLYVHTTPDKKNEEINRIYQNL